MKFNLFASILLSGIFTLPVFAGRVITYTATSTTSQEDANNAAVAGIAKQIVSQVNSSQTLTKSETTQKGENILDESFFAINNVKSNIQLKGVTIVPAKTDGKKFGATATLDLDEFTADLQFRMKTIQQDVAKLEGRAKAAIESRLYSDAANDILAAQTLVPEHERFLQQLSKVYPINDSHRLVQNLDVTNRELSAKISTIKLGGPAEIATITADESVEWKISVQDAHGPLPGFPLVANLGKATLTEKKTDNSGIAIFKFSGKELSKGEGVLRILPNLPLNYLKENGLERGISINFEVKKPQCSIQLKCSQGEALCSTLEEVLQKRNIDVSSDASAPALEATISATEKNTLNVGSSTMKSYDVKLNIKGSNILFSTSNKGVGKDENDAIQKSLQKTDFTKFESQLKPFCK